jgi:hypothetical protein
MARATAAIVACFVNETFIAALLVAGYFFCA